MFINIRSEADYSFALTLTY